MSSSCSSCSFLEAAATRATGELAVQASGAERTVDTSKEKEEKEALEKAAVQKVAAAEKAYFNCAEAQKAAAMEKVGQKAAAAESERSPWEKELMAGLGLGELDVAELLSSEKPTSPSTGNDGWYTALMLAARRGHESHVRSLIDARANVDARTPDARSRGMMAFVHDDGEEGQKYGGCTALALAAQNRQGGSVRALIEAKANLETQDATGCTALLCAAEASCEAWGFSLKMVGFGPAPVGRPDQKARAALLANYNEPCLQLLIDAKANLEATEEYGHTALMLFASVGHLPGLRAMFDAKANLDAALPLAMLQASMAGSALPGGFTALMISAHVGETECLQALIEAKADLNAESMQHFTGLSLAFKQCRGAKSKYRSDFEECALLLLRAGARLEKGDWGGSTPRSIAQEKPVPEGREAAPAHARMEKVLALFTEAEEQAEEAVRAAVAGDPAPLRALEGEMTLGAALCAAAAGGFLEPLRELLDRKVAVEFANEDQTTPLSLACIGGHQHCAQALVEAGANVGAVDKNEATALMYSAQQGHEACVHILIAGGANLDTTEEDGNSALMISAMEGHVLCVSALLEAKADPNVDSAAAWMAAWDGMTAPKHETALILACNNENEDCAQLLRQAGAIDDLGLLRARLLSLSFTGAAPVIETPHLTLAVATRNTWPAP